MLNLFLAFLYPRYCSYVDCSMFILISSVHWKREFYFLTLHYELTRFDHRSCWWSIYSFLVNVFFCSCLWNIVHSESTISFFVEVWPVGSVFKQNKKQTRSIFKSNSASVQSDQWSTCVVELWDGQFEMSMSGWAALFSQNLQSHAFWKKSNHSWST